MLRNKASAIVLSITLMTASAMTGMAFDRAHTLASCRDVRIGMDGAIGATIETTALSQRTLVNIFTTHFSGKTKLGTIEINATAPEKHAMTYTGSNFKLTVFNKENPKTGRFPAKIEAQVGQQRVVASLGCIK